MAKEKRRVLGIFFEGLKIYCLNIHKFLLYMAFPVLGQIIGLFLIFGPTFFYTNNLQDLTAKYKILNDANSMIICALIIIIPGLLIFMKAFWDYLVSYGALNSMTEGYLSTGKVYDFKSHNEVVLNKTFSFIALWFLFSIFTILALFPVFWILGFIFFIYFILIFQVFTFENGLSPIGYFRRSFQIIRGNFARTFILMFLLFIITYYLLSSGISVLFDHFNLTNLLSKGLESWVLTLPIEPLEPYGVTPLKIASGLITNMIMFIAIGFTLPLRSICWTLWYNNLNDIEEEQLKKIVKKPSKKTSKKTTKSFKIEKREIDPEIIRRARLEDDEY